VCDYECSSLYVCVFAFCHHTHSVKQARILNCSSYLSFFYVSVCLCPSVFSVHLSKNLSIHSTVLNSMYLSVYLSICPSVHPTVCLSVYLSVCVKIYQSTQCFVDLSAFTCLSSFSVLLVALLPLRVQFCFLCGTTLSPSALCVSACVMSLCVFLCVYAIYTDTMMNM